MPGPGTASDGAGHVRSSARIGLPGIQYLLALFGILPEHDGRTRQAAVRADPRREHPLRRRPDIPPAVQNRPALSRRREVVPAGLNHGVRLRPGQGSPVTRPPRTPRPAHRRRPAPPWPAPGPGSCRRWPGSSPGTGPASAARSREVQRQWSPGRASRSPHTAAGASRAARTPPARPTATGQGRARQAQRRGNDDVVDTHLAPSCLSLVRPLFPLIIKSNL